jgi:hypothetical protein
MTQNFLICLQIASSHRHNPKNFDAELETCVPRIYGAGTVFLDHALEANPASRSLFGGDGGSVRAREDSARRFA